MDVSSPLKHLRRGQSSGSTSSLPPVLTLPPRAQHLRPEDHPSTLPRIPVLPPLPHPSKMAPRFFRGGGPLPRMPFGQPLWLRVFSIWNTEMPLPGLCQGDGRQRSPELDTRVDLRGRGDRSPGNGPCVRRWGDQPAAAASGAASRFSQWLLPAGWEI